MANSSSELRDELNARIGAKARAMREGRKMTLREAVELAKSVGCPMTIGLLSNLERGSRLWNTEYVATMAAVYGVDAAAFFVTLEEQGILMTWRTGGAKAAIAWLVERL